MNVHERSFSVLHPKLIEFIPSDMFCNIEIIVMNKIVLVLLYLRKLILQIQRLILHIIALFMELLSFQRVARIISKTWVNKLCILSAKIIIIFLFIIIDGILSRKEHIYSTLCKHIDY
jgi:hypothetical protein